MTQRREINLRVGPSRNRRLVALMPQICEWLRANGIRPIDVPVSEVPEVTDAIRVRVYKRDAAGRFYVDRLTGDLASERRVFALRQAPPPALRPWLDREIVYVE